MDVLVIGGTGTVGSLVVKGLVERGAEPRVMSRSPESAEEGGPSGAEYVHGDLSSPKTLPSVFEGMEKLYLLTPVHPSEATLGINAVRAAEQAGLKHIVFHSIHDVEAAPEPLYHDAKIQITEALGESGIDSTLIRPNNFYQNDLLLEQLIMKQGAYPQPIGRVGLNRVDVRDVADAAVNALLEPGHEGKTYPVVGPDTLTGPDVAEIYSRHLPHEVQYGGDDLDTWAQKIGVEMPDWLVEEFRLNYQFFQEEGLRATREELDHQREVLGHEPRPFEPFVEEVVAKWTESAPA